jgi:riboflavin synthase
MFTGIVERTGLVVEVREAAQGKRLRIKLFELAETAVEGDSVAIDGVCLTVSRLDAEVAVFDVIPETLRRSTFNRLKAGDQVNLERSMRIGSRIDGHFVQGHVDAVGEIAEVRRAGRERTMTIKVPPDIEPLLVPKGSVAVDGISLTIASSMGDRFTVALIPTTLNRTVIDSRRVGDSVNVETDLLVRTIRHLLQAELSSQSSSGLKYDHLASTGFG